MAALETSPMFCVRGTTPPPRRLRPRKMTNSEKTSTTNNLSQHKYPKLKRQLQHDETDNALIAIRDAGFQNRDHSLRSTTAQDRRQKCASIPASSNVQHRYKLVSDWDSQWQAIYRHFTTCHQQRYPSSYQGSAATSHLLNKGSSDLPNLLTSTRLTPQVPSNQRNAALCNYYPSQQRTSHNSAISAASGANASIEDPLCYDQSMDITPDDTCDSYNGDCMSDYLPMNCTDPLIMSTVYMSSAASTTMADTNKRTSWYSEYLRSTLQRMHARTRNERKKTKSAPGGSVSLLTKDSSKQRTELCASATITYFSQRDVKGPSGGHEVVVDFDVLKADKAKEVLSKPPPLYKPDPKPRSHWYEMRTPGFHREARRNNVLIRKSCDW